LANNSRFLILPEGHVPNLASRILSLCEKRLPGDWQENFGHPLVLLETFVDPQRFQGTVYKAANWLHVGETKGFRRTPPRGTVPRPNPPKWFSLNPYRGMPEQYYPGRFSIHLIVQEDTKSCSVPNRWNPYPVSFVRSPIPAGAKDDVIPFVRCWPSPPGQSCVGCGGTRAISDWAQSLGPKARERFDCRREKGRYLLPSEYVIRDVLIRVNPVDLDRALQRWNKTYGDQDESLAIDGKTMCNAIDEQGHQTHVMSVIGHQSKACYTQKKWGLSRS